MPLQGSEVQVICTVNRSFGAHSTTVPRKNPHKTFVDLTTVDDGILKPTKCLTLLLQNAKRVMEHVGFTMYRISRLSLVEAQFRKPLVAAQVHAGSHALKQLQPRLQKARHQRDTAFEGLHSYAAWNGDRCMDRVSKFLPIKPRHVARAMNGTRLSELCHQVVVKVLFQPLLQHVGGILNKRPAW